MLDDVTVLVVCGLILLRLGWFDHLGIATAVLFSEFSASFHLAGTAVLNGALRWLARLQLLSIVFEWPNDLLQFSFACALSGGVPIDTTRKGGFLSPLGAGYFFWTDDHLGGPHALKTAAEPAISSGSQQAEGRSW